MEIHGLLHALGCDLAAHEGEDIAVYSPIDGGRLATLKAHTSGSITETIARAATAFEAWRKVPPPVRGQLVRLLGDELRQAKEPLGQVVTLECGKILEEGKGEVQEMIDICDFAVGLSRQLYGLTIASERAHHTMEENWLPLGPVGIISAFNFPVAVWSWNAALALVCGDTLVWKPSEKTLLTALACQAILLRACARFEDEGHGTVPEGLCNVIIGEAAAGAQLVDDPRIRLVSATGSCRMGGIVGPEVARRFGKYLLELGGNNAVIVTPSADLDVALPSLLFGAVGTAGQRCTTTRRAFVHRSIYDEVFEKLKTAYAGLESKIGNPLEAGTLVGPLIDAQAGEAMDAALEAARAQGCEVYFGERVMTETYPEARYVHPALVKAPTQTAIIATETFAPILYVMPYDSLEEAMQWHNAVAQGLSSAIFTTDVREAEYFKQTSDCGIANVNIGTSGAEIGGAFGGEKETGGGRESGSDAWKVYMRRQTSTTYWGTDAPALAQGIKFEV